MTHLDRTLRKRLGIEIKQDEVKHASLMDERSTWKPTMSVGEARAIIASTEARPIWVKTEGCKKTPGSTSRSICERYNGAQAAVAMWDAKGTLETRIAEAEVDLKATREKLASMELRHSGGTDQGVALASLMTATEKPDGSKRYWASMALVSLLAIFAIMAGGLINYVVFSFEAGTKAMNAVQAAASSGMHVATRSVSEILNDRRNLRIA